MRAEFQDCHFGTVAKSIIAAAFGRQRIDKKIRSDDGAFSSINLVWRIQSCYAAKSTYLLAPSNIMYNNTCIVDYLCYTPIDILHLTKSLYVHGPNNRHVV